MDKLFVVLVTSYDETTYIGVFDNIDLAKEASQKYDKLYAKDTQTITWRNDETGLIYSQNTYESHVIIPSIVNENREALWV